MKVVKGALASTFLRGEVDLRVKELSPLGGHEQGDTGTSSSGLGMEHPEAAAEVEVKASLGEVLSRQQQR